VPRGPGGWGRWLLLTLLLGLVLALLLLEGQRRHGLYWYDVSADYQFRFQGDEVRRFPVRIAESGFRLPPWDGEWDTALLRLSVERRLAGWWFEPHLEIQVPGSTSCLQFLERGSAGRRYLDLCLRAGDAEPGDFVRLSSHHVDVPDQEAELLLFSAPDPDTTPLLVLSPHPDDAEIAAFGLYAHRESWIATVTTGSYGGDEYRHLVADSAQRDALQARLRLWDSLVVPRWGGVGPEQALNLGYPARFLQQMHCEDGVARPDTSGMSADMARWRSWNHSVLLDDRPAVPTWENLVSDLEMLLDRIQPGIVVSPHPALDASADHVFVTAALLEALRRRDDPEIFLFLYTNHHPLTAYFPPGPAGAAVSLPPWFDSATPFRSVYSHPLDPQLQVRKLFALDRMSDLRTAPEPVYGGPAGRVSRRLISALREIWRDPARELSYFRRGIRSNELFFVYSQADRQALEELIPRREVSCPASP